MLLSWLSDRFGRRIVTCTALVITGATTALVITTETVAELVVLRVIAGLAMGVIVATLPSLAGEFSPSRHKTLIISVLLAGGSLGAVAGGFIAAAVIQDYGWQVIFLYAGILTAILGVLIFLSCQKQWLSCLNKIRGTPLPPSTER